MINKTFDNYLFRCSSLGKLMTRDGLKTKTTQDYLMEIFFEYYCGIPSKDLDFKYLKKGIECEPDSFKLLSEIRGRFMSPNKLRLQNDFLTGKHDYKFESEVEDLKTSWDKISFFNADIISLYDWQLEGYKMIDETIKTKRLTYVLVNTPAHFIEDEKMFLMKKIEAGSDEFINECKKIEILHIHDMKQFQNDYPDFFIHSDLSTWKYDMKKEDRVKSFLIPNKSEDDLKKVKNRIIESKNFLNSLAEKFNK